MTPVLDHLFPLPLTPFERHMLADDRPGHPMTCAAELRLSGTIDREALSASFRDTLLRHPLLSAIVDRTHPNRPCWVPAPSGGRGIEWSDSESLPASEELERMNLALEAGLRFQVRQDSGRQTATMLYHHSCCDGIGAARFIEDLLAAYHLRVEGRSGSEALPVSDDARLLQRGEMPRIGRLCARMAHEIRTVVREGRHWLLHPVTPLGLPIQTETSSTGVLVHPATLTHAFSESASVELLAAARRRGVTLNDLFLAAMFLTIVQWNAVHAPETRTRWLRIAVPQNLRADADRWMPAANKVTMCFLTRAHDACRNATTLLRGIHDEMASARYWLRGKSLLRAMRWVQAVPGAARCILEGDRCLATVVLSNIGDYDRWFCSELPREGKQIRAGDIRLESITNIPPIRSMTHAAFGAASYGGILRMSLRHDHCRLASEQANQLLALYVSQIERIAEVEAN